MGYRNDSPTVHDVRRAIKETRLRVLEDGRVIETNARTKTGPRWHTARRELVCPQGRRHARPYERIGFAHSGGLCRGLVHRVIWFARVGPIPTGRILDHVDGNKLHNWLSNLEPVTEEESVRRAIALGLFDPHAPKNHSISWDLAESIRVRVTNGERQADLCREFNLSPNVVNRIVLGLTYVRKH